MISIQKAIQCFSIGDLSKMNILIVKPEKCISNQFQVAVLQISTHTLSSIFLKNILLKGNNKYSLRKTFRSDYIIQGNPTLNSDRLLFYKYLRAVNKLKHTKVAQSIQKYTVCPLKICTQQICNILEILQNIIILGHVNTFYLVVIVLKPTNRNSYSVLWAQFKGQFIVSQ